MTALCRANLIVVLWQQRAITIFILCCCQHAPPWTQRIRVIPLLSLSCRWLCAVLSLTENHHSLKEMLTISASYNAIPSHFNSCFAFFIWCTECSASAGVTADKMWQRVRMLWNYVVEIHPKKKTQSSCMHKCECIGCTLTLFFCLHCFCVKALENKVYTIKVLKVFK